MEMQLCLVCQRPYRVKLKYNEHNNLHLCSKKCEEDHEKEMEKRK